MLLCSSNGLLGLSVLFASPLTQELLGWPIPAPHASDVATYADIDRALESRELIPLGESWRFFPGTREPSEAMEWVSPDFDDSDWEVGTSPFTFGGQQQAAGGTNVAAFGEGVSTLYLRCKLFMPDPSLYEGIWLEMLVDDGYILYLNKVEERRLAAGDAEERQAFDATATSERRLEERPMPRFDLTRPIKAGINQIALQALVADSDRNSFGFYPSVRAIYRSTPESEQAHYQELRQLILTKRGALLVRQLAYLEARHQQRLGNFAEAAKRFQKVVSLDPSAVLAHRRLRECHRELGTLERLEAWLREGLLEGSAPGAWLNQWSALWLEDLGRPLDELLAQLPEHLTLAPAAGLDDALWAARGLASGAPLRINCGAQEDIELNGIAWSRDRFGAAGFEASDSNDPLAVGRGSKRDMDSLEGMYRIPVLNGSYQVKLWAAHSSAGQAFDVYLEGTRHQARKLSSDWQQGLSLVAQVRDGFLDLDLAAIGKGQVLLGALELERLHDGGLLEAARQAAAKSGTALAWVQLGEAEWEAGNLRAALEAYERAEPQLSFNLEQRARLGELRDAILPAILSLSSATDLSRRYAADWEQLWAAAGEAEGSDEEALAYFAGACHQNAREFDEALGYFEQLVFDKCQEPQPYIGMALCLAGVGLPEDAAGILDLAFENGLPAEGDLLQTWISMQLGGLQRDPWDLVDQLMGMQVPPHLVLVPTSEEYGRPWRHTFIEPTATTWSRPTFSVDEWATGLGPIGCGTPLNGYPRALWNRIMLFARTSFELPAPNLLYPFLRVYGRGANDVYLNGTRVSRHSLATDGYKQLPLRAPSVSGAATSALSTGLQEGTNLLGMFGFNTRGSGMLDVGIQQDFETLFWIRNELNTRGALRFNCGGEAYTSVDGRLFHGDRFYNWAIPGRLAAQAETQAIGGTHDEELYRTTRRFYDDSVSAWYEVPLPDGAYKVVLHFAEINAKYREPGARSFDVTIEGVRQLSELDVAAEAGFMSALVREFDVQVVDGWMDVKLTHKEHFSFLNALEIIAK